MRRYDVVAPLYDLVSLERPLYRAGRFAAISALGLRPGDRVLDVGCGTGLSLGPLTASVGERGLVVGLDPSAAMLRQASRRCTGARLVNGTVDALGERAGTYDAALFAYCLGVLADWRATWSSVLRLVRPGGRIAVVDTAWPTGPWRIAAPLAGLAMLSGGVHPSRRVWERPLRELAKASGEVLWGGHVRVGAGSVP